MGYAVAVKLNAISELIRLPKQYGTLLLLWPTLWSLLIASNGTPSLKHIAIFITGTFLMRSAGCAINDIADRNFDPHVERTRKRPLADGRLNIKEAMAVFIGLSILAFLLVLSLNRLTIMLSFIGIALASIYPFIKRVSHWPQAFLGMAFGWGGVMAWTAVKGSLDIMPFIIFFANVLWSIAYDTIYALMDKEDDERIGVRSTAILFGNEVYKIIKIIYVCFFALLAAGGAYAGLGLIYYTGLAAGFFYSLSIVSVIKKAGAGQGAIKGFLANAYLGGLIFLALLIDLNF